MKKILFLLLFIMPLVFGSAIINNVTLPKTKKEKKIIKRKIPTIDVVYHYMLEKNIKFPLETLSQWCFETGYFKCKGCSMDYNNLGGYRNKNGYLKFKSWRESVDYHKRFQDRNGYDENDNFYVILCNSNYFEADSAHYIGNIKKIKERLSTIVN